MIYLLHGNDTAKSRLEMREITGSAVEAVYFDGNKLNITDLVSFSESLSLFSQKKTVIIENFSKRKPGREKTECLNYIFDKKHSIDFILWEDSEIEKAKISKLPDMVTTLKFDFPAYLFKFLDSLGFVSAKNSVSGFHNLLKNNDVELIFTMIARQLRFLIMVKDETKNITGLPDWQYLKFKSQARLFESKKLVNLYRKLLQLDYQFKSGLTPYGKKELLDIFLVNF